MKSDVEQEDSATYRVDWHHCHGDNIALPCPKYELFSGHFRPNYFFSFKSIFSERHHRLILILPLKLPNCPELKWVILF